MKKGRILSLLLVAVLLALLVLAGCSNSAGKADDGPITLRLLTDLETVYGNSVAEEQLALLISQFQTEHCNVTIELEELPGDAREREIVLDRLKTEIIAGDGPDMYLLPTGISVDDNSGEQLELLFTDVNQSMQNGIFADITEFYDKDADLDGAGLNAVIMDAGVIDGRRYTLPLRFDYPVVTVRADAIERLGLNAEAFDKGVTAIMDAITLSGDAELAASASIYTFDHCMNFFPDLLDYDDQRVALSKEQLAKFMTSWLAFYESRIGVLPQGGFCTLVDYVQHEDWIHAGEVIEIDSVQNSIFQAACAKLEGIELQMYPLTGVDGKLVAEVTQFAAVSAGSKHPELAYSFLRQLLTKENQWELNVDNKNNPNPAMAGEGYCVRSEGSVSDCYCSVYTRTLNWPWDPENEETTARLERLRTVELTDSDVPVLQSQIDVARYPVPELEQILASRITFPVLNPMPEGLDPNAIADDIIRQMEFHLYEG